MIRYLLFLFFLVSSLRVNSQNSIIVAIFPDECTNSLALLTNLNKVDRSLSIHLVIQKNLQGDSASIRKNLQLDDYRLTTISYNDSIYMKFKNKRGIQSTIALYNSATKKTIKTGIVEIEKFIGGINKLNMTDTIHLSEYAIGGTTSLRNSSRYYYLHNRNSGDIKAFNKIDGNLSFTLLLTDSMIRSVYKLRFPNNIWEKEYAESQEAIKRKRIIDGNVFKSFFLVEDTIYVRAQHHYVIHDTADKFPRTTVFLSVLKFINGRLVDLSVLENYIDPSFKGMNRGIRQVTAEGNPVKNPEAYMIPTGQIMVYKGNLYSELLAGYSNGIPNYFLAMFAKDKTQTYQFKEFYKRELPNEYAVYGYDGLFPGEGIAYSSGYISLLKSNTLLPMDKENSPIRLQTRNLNLFDMKISGNIVYLLYLQDDSEIFKVKKIDLTGKSPEQEVDVANVTAKWFVSLCLDEYDPNFVNLTYGSQDIIRRKVF